jgi:hypothetical protein
VEQLRARTSLRFAWRRPVRATKLVIETGHVVIPSQPMFTVETTSMVLARNDFISASGPRKLTTSDSAR